ncbi:MULTISPECIES: type VII toxin-antitoxin system MntA family adenylyltransferase antitoxin [Desulfosediminicola]|uniref:type VII toxin-antitoxin system MntA family adenylyltransferase antitoxin n=1 Tax=Desulfosediminicola TaxID=2886823 RepID=UPI0010ABC6B5|nr:nucleotidyltransferase domain-containing protein [Desulfosediminicola ganghwensis]
MDTDKIKSLLSPVFAGFQVIDTAVLFGSRAVGEHTVNSDVDIAVFIKQGAEFSFDDKLMLRGECCRALNINEIDLVVLNQLRNMILLENILSQHEVLYSVNGSDFDYFSVRKLHQAIDFRVQRAYAMGEE